MDLAQSAWHVKGGLAYPWPSMMISPGFVSTAYTRLPMRLFKCLAILDCPAVACCIIVPGLYYDMYTRQTSLPSLGT